MNLGHFGVTDMHGNNEEITSNDVPDPDVLPRVCGDWILVRPVTTRQEKVGSIILADTTSSDIKYLNNVGRILAFGPRAYRTKEGKIIDWVEGGLEIGNFVQWERFVGKRLRYKGVNLVLLKDVAIQLVLEDPEDMDSMVALEN